MSEKSLADLDGSVLKRLINFLDPISVICFALTSKHLHDLIIANFNAQTLIGVLLTPYVHNHVCLCWCCCEGYPKPAIEFIDEEGMLTWIISSLWLRSKIGLDHGSRLVVAESFKLGIVVTIADGSGHQNSHISSSATSIPTS